MSGKPKCHHHGDHGTYMVRCSHGNVWIYGHYVGRVNDATQGVAAILAAVEFQRFK